MRYETESEWPDMPQADWQKWYGDVEGSSNLHEVFKKASTLGYYPYRQYIWKNEEWYVSENSSPPGLFLTGSEAKDFTIQQFVQFVDRAREEWEFIPNEPSEENGWRDWTGKWKRIDEDIV